MFPMCWFTSWSNLGSGLVKPQLAAEQLQIGGLSREESPSRPDAVHLPVMLDHVHGVLVRLQRERIHKHLPADLVTEQLLHFDHVGGDNRTNLLTPGKKEVDGNDLALDQVIVKPHFFIVL